MITRTLVCAVSVLTAAVTTQAQQKERIGVWVADLRVSSVGLPSEPGWTPNVPTGTVAPTRALGLEIGAHVNVLRFRAIALGLGGTWLSARGTSSPPDPTTAPPPTPTIPEVTTRITSLTPQVSLNFGHSLGWSYLSAGLGRSRVESEAVLTGQTFTPRDSDWVKTLNYGGGARWFVNDHIGVGFDIRWHKLGLVAASASHPGAPRASVFVAGAGVVVK
jgi:Outer membrane protein beta-barrel domain